jgi:hypothetical protein
MFNSRGPNDVTFYTAGNIVRHTLNDGDNVTLRSGDKTVFVREVVTISAGRFSGTIYGFEPSHLTACNGLELDQQVEFQEHHIFGCGGA